MQFREICSICVILIIAGSTIYLSYLTFSNPLPHMIRLRFINFIVQHLMGLGMLIKRQFFWSDIQTNRYLCWMVAFTGINFLDFIAIEACGLILENKQKIIRNIQDYDISFMVLSYFHLYYQYNIYIGVFSLFTIAMLIIYTLNQRRHQQQMEQVLEQIKSQKYSTSFRQQSCSICLAEFQKTEHVYKLVCGHIFHKDCLKDWFKQKLTCPMCRDDATRIVNYRPIRDSDDQYDR